MNEDEQKDLKATDASPPAGTLDNEPRRTRKPSEMKRFGASLNVLQATGLQPRSVCFYADGGFEIKFLEETSTLADGYDRWFAEQLSAVDE